MLETEAQQLVVFSHPEHKLFHIGTHSVKQVKLGQATLSVNISKAKYAINKHMAGGKEAAAHFFDHGFYLSLMATDFTGWEYVIHPNQYTLANAVEARDTLVQEMEALGFRKVTGRYIKTIRTNRGKNKGWGAKLSVNKRGEKLYPLVYKILDAFPTIPEDRRKSLANSTVRLCWNPASDVEYVGDLFIYIHNQLVGADA